MLATVVVAVLVALACAAQASAAAPAWRLDSLANTTAVPGGTMNYLEQITNVGDANADLSVNQLTFTAHMPAGVHATSVTFNGSNYFNWDCSATTFPATDVTCTDSTDFWFKADTCCNDHLLLQVFASVDPTESGTRTARFQVSGGGASAPTTTFDPTTITSTPPGFGVDAFDGQVTDGPGGDPFTQAGGHPYAITTSIDVNTTENLDLAPPYDQLWPVEPVRDISVDLPPGLVGDPTSLAECTSADLAHALKGFDVRPLCPPTSQVGETLIRLNGLAGHPSGFGPVPVYNMVPGPNVPARFGFNVEGTVVTLDAKLRSNGDYGLSVDASKVPEALGIVGTTVTFWGVPADPGHDAERACPGAVPPFIGGPHCSSGAPLTAFLRNPTACTAAGVGLPFAASIDSWEHPGDFVSAGFFSHLPPAYPSPPEDQGQQQGPTGCDQVPFDPTLTGAPASGTAAGAPAGFTFDVTVPQTDDPTTIGQGDLKKAVVTLPVGVSVSPSSADGLGACSSAQIGLLGTSFPEPNRIRFSQADPACPDSSKVGSVTIDTPLLPKPLIGSIYLAAQTDNPFGSLIAIYLVAKGPGVIVKLPGEVEMNGDNGQLTATFDDNPQLPFSSLHLEFKGGPRAPLVTPRQCGTYATHAVLTSWSGATATTGGEFTVSGDGHGAPCPASGFSPGFSAGTDNPVAGGDSPFLLRLTRGDQDQELSGLTVDMPTGLLGRIANATLCPDGAADAGTCVDASKIGSVAVGAGRGSNPFYITNGRAYITGPYKGAPYGLSIVVPAVAGPFDLGNVVVRTAIFVDRTTSALKVVSDPFPTILKGIPLSVRDVRVTIDKPKFIVNPTSCAEKSVRGTVTSTEGTVAHVSDRFQVGDCASLSLAPKMTLTVGAQGHTRAGVSTPLTATLTQKPGQSNLRSVSVTLPGTINALLPVINQACKLTEFQAGKCTSKAKVGTAVAVTPLLRDPLRGSAYFVKNPARAIPDLMVALRGQVSLDLTGKVFIPGGKRLATRFDTIPDAPITKFSLRLVSGKNGPIGVATNLCSAKGRSATAALGFRGQNGRLVQLDQRLNVVGCPKASKARRARRRH